MNAGLPIGLILVVYTSYDSFHIFQLENFYSTSMDIKKIIVHGHSADRISLILIPSPYVKGEIMRLHLISCTPSLGEDSLDTARSEHKIIKYLSRVVVAARAAACVQNEWH